MTDRYTRLVNTGLTGQLAKRLGLPRPARLRREVAGDPLLPGPALVLADSSSVDAADLVGQHLLDLGLDVRRRPGDEKLGAVVLVVSELADVRELREPVLAAGAVLRQLAPGARLITVSRPAAPGDGPRLAAARGAIDGLLRSAAKEMRGGSTANGVLLAPGIDVTAPSLAGALWFFCSGRSAFVDGQFLTVSGQGGRGPAPHPLRGRVAVITGAARGIGAAIARQFAADGARLLLVDVPAASEQLTRVANEVRGVALGLDITAADAGAPLLEVASQRFGRLDIVVHNAGITRDKLLANMTADRWDAVIEVNLAAQLTINEALLASELFGDRPHIVCLASTSGIAGNRGQTNYGASKAGVIGMVRATAPLLTGVGGTINAVAPGFIETDMTAKIPPIQREIFRRTNSLQQGGLPRDVAAAIAFLASPQADGITGQVLRVCGQNLVGQ